MAQSENPHEDDAPALPDHPVSRAGDLWVCGKHRILCEDATSPDATLRLLGERNDETVCDRGKPPRAAEVETDRQCTVRQDRVGGRLQVAAQE